MPVSPARRSARSPSTWGLWHATSTFTRRQYTPRASSSARRSASAPVSPETTVDRALFDAAAHSRSSRPMRARRASSSDSSTTAMPPCPAIVPSRRLRRAMTRAASASDSAPATCAAATSPMLWPTTASGSIPHARHSAARATSIAKSAGCVTSTRSSLDRSESATSSSRSDQSTCGASARSHSLQRLPEHTLGREQRSPHSEKLGARAREHEDHARPRRSCPAGHEPGQRLTRHVRPQRSLQLVAPWPPPRPGDARGACGERWPCTCGRGDPRRWARARAA